MRIVSLNLCTDQLLMQLVEPRRIAAVTQLAADPHFSAMAAEARRLPVTRGTAEEVIALRPDLVLAGTFSARQAVAMLRRLGYPVVELAPESDFAAITTNIRLLAAAVGERERGEALVRELETALAAVPPAPQDAPLYADYAANGFSSGNGTLLAEVANRAGFRTLGQHLGWNGVRQVSLEQMLHTPPTVIDLGDPGSAPALAQENTRHPAMRHVLHDAKVLAIPSRYTACGNLRTLRALEALVAARRGLDA
ncbi:ABC transporter substrate-binding protein [Altererythrobacter lauratis]|uniref:ABC transporter substrate-binding protein n=1 Tax=Alteraurantiacibacter lauratis TaxID=2054627 RepID=A0ABV7EF48_9SPHN